MADVFLPRGATDATPKCGAQIAVTAVVSQLTLPVSPGSQASLRLVVKGAADIAWCFGPNANLTMANGVYMIGGTVEVFGIPPGVTQLSVIGAAAGSVLIAGIGDGQ